MVIINGTKVAPLRAVVIKAKEPRVSRSKVGKRTVMVTSILTEREISVGQQVHLGGIVYVHPSVYEELKESVCK